MTPYQLVGFLDNFDQWAGAEDSDQTMRVVVLDWVMTRQESPYQGVRREPSFENLWFGAIPRTARGDQVVVCSYWIEEHDHIVRCDRIATLSLPL